MNNKEFIRAIKEGSLSEDYALKILDSNSYEDLGFAKIDFDRKKRRGFPETIYAKSKDNKSLLEIFMAFDRKEEPVLASKASLSQYEFLKNHLARLEYDKLGQIITLRKNENKLIGNIAIVAAGTSDLPIAREAELTCNFFGAKTTNFYDVGVAGLQRLLSKIDQIRKANVIIAIAGMEAALATVLAGLVAVPIIAVPTSVGYGASLKGITALLSMINSCAEGISVVNIDNGYGAAYQACQINRLIEKR